MARTAYWALVERRMLRTSPGLGLRQVATRRKPFLLFVSSSTLRSRARIWSKRQEMAFASGSGRRPCSRSALSSVFSPSDMTHPTGDPDHGGVGRNLLDDHRVRADLAVVANREGTEDLGSGPDDDVVAQGRMTLLLGPGGPAEGHAVVKGAVVADFGGFPDHHPHAVVDEKAADRSWLRDEFRCRSKTARNGKPDGRENKICAARGHGQAVKKHRVEAGIAENYFENAANCRITLENHLEIFF